MKNKYDEHLQDWFNSNHANNENGLKDFCLDNPVSFQICKNRGWIKLREAEDSEVEKRNDDKSNKIIEALLNAPIEVRAEIINTIMTCSHNYNKQAHQEKLTPRQLKDYIETISIGVELTKKESKNKTDENKETIKRNIKEIQKDPFKKFYKTSSKKQLDYLLLEDEHKKVIICEGTVNSGKSFINRLLLIKYILKANDKKYNGILCGRTQTTAYELIVYPLIEMLEEIGIEYHLDKSKENKLQILNHTFKIFGSSDQASYEKIRGSNYNLAMVEEINLLEESSIDEIYDRLRIGDNPHLIASLNGTSPSNFIYKRWIDNDEMENELEYIHWDFDDNLTIAPGFVDGLKALYVPGSADWIRKIEGIRAAQEGVIYNTFNPETMVIADDLKPKSPLAWCFGMDYGASGVSCVYECVVHMDRTGKEIYYIKDEYYYDVSKHNNNSLSDGQLFEKLINHFEDLNPKVDFYTPHDANSFKSEMNEKGYNALGYKPNTIKDINLIKELFLKGKILINERCSHLIDDLQSYMWNSQAQEKKGIDEPLKINDHSVDGFRLAVVNAHRKGVYDYYNDYKEKEDNNKGFPDNEDEGLHLGF